MDDSDIADLLRAQRTTTRARVQEMTREYEAIVAASADANVDDEHDPEGSTIAFERAQLAAVLAQAQTYLDDLDRAELRLAGGSYGRCEVCGTPIAPARLAAIPVARACFRCASDRARR